MSFKKIQSILKDVLEEEIPSSQINLWPAVKADLVAGKYLQNQQGVSMNTIKSRRIPRFALALSLLLALLLVFFATPQGRTFAQSVVAFFTRGERITFPVEDSQTASFEADKMAPTALPPAPLISVAEAESQVGFSVAEIADIPEGFDYLGARLYGNYVSLDYMTKGYGHLLIMQSQEGFYQSDWDVFPAEDILPVKIGDLDGEIVQGSFIRYPGETNATWNSDAAFTHMRWVSSGVWFEISLYGDAHQYLDLAGLIQIAQGLTFQP